MIAALQASTELEALPACIALGVARATFYRHRDSQTGAPTRVIERSPQARSLSPEERNSALEILASERFADSAPRQIWAALLDQRKYVCSVSTMYRLLKAEWGVRERRDQLRHPTYSKPELIATGPNQVSSWDITKLMGPAKWTYFYLYVVLDIFSRYVVGWILAPRESATLAQLLIDETCAKQFIAPGQLTIHADRGSAMKSGLVAQLLADLGITKTHSRPYVSDDNPFSESQFRTMKYRPQFPDRFDSIQDARAFYRIFFDWYNTQHHHSGIALHTPHSVHHGLAKELNIGRQLTLTAAHSAHPERFVRNHPEPPALPKAVWINPPTFAGIPPDSVPVLH